MNKTIIKENLSKKNSKSIEMGIDENQSEWAGYDQGYTSLCK